MTGILSGDRILLSKAITLLESNLDRHRERAAEVISACLPYSGKSIRIAVTGVPGAGKSSFIESFGLFLVEKGLRVAVLAIDPSSSLSKGSILGDKTRMELLSRHENAFIRPSPSGGTLGGVARKTRESIFLCEAAGFDVILIETVGVGQSEVAAHSMADFFLLILISGAGDELQGIKRGIMELADAILVNKADGENLPKAKLARAELSRAMQFLPKRKDGWKPSAMLSSTLENLGMHETWEKIDSYISQMREKGLLEDKRGKQAEYWLAESIKDELFCYLESDESLSQNWNELQAQVKQGYLSAYSAARQVLSQLKK